MNQTTDFPNQEPISRLGLSLLIILLGSFLSPVLVHSATIAIPALASELKLTAEEVSWFTFVPAMGNVLLVLPAGKLADIYGRRRAFCGGLLLAALGCWLAGAASAAWLLLMARFLMGASLAFVWAAALALVSSIPRPENKVKVLGIFASVCYLGIVTGPIWGGLIVEQLHWRWVFLIPGAVLLPIALAGLFCLDWEKYGDRSRRLKLSDTALYMLAVTLLGCTVFSQSSLQTATLTISGVAVFWFFCRLQNQRDDPLLQTRLFTHNLQYSTMAISHLIIYICIFSLPFTLTLYLGYIRALDASSIGWIIMAQAMSTCLLSPFSGRLATHFQTSTLIYTGLFLSSLGAWGLTGLHVDTPLWQVVLFLVAIGLGVGLLDPQVFHLATSSVSEALLGSASATLNGMRTLGGFIGLGIASTLIEQQLGGMEISQSALPALGDLLRQLYWLSAGLLLLVLVLMIWGLNRIDQVPEGLESPLENSET